MSGNCSSFSCILFWQVHFKPAAWSQLKQIFGLSFPHIQILSKLKEVSGAWLHILS